MTYLSYNAMHHTKNERRWKKKVALSFVSRFFCFSNFLLSAAALADGPRGREEGGEGEEYFLPLPSGVLADR